MLGRSLVLCVVLGLAASPAYAVRLSIKNNLPESEDGSVLEIEEASSKEAPDNKVRFQILPGETKELTGGNVTNFVLVRIFKRHKLKYDVRCPASAEGQAVISLLEVHDERLPSGCKVVRRGHWSKRSGTNWDE
ncbi:MAG: hypothetical protein KDD69_17405 [Bdellovibrionales bacterium]|nr:hypothetical protein [Bdellovibrionales bacterium]